MAEKLTVITEYDFPWGAKYTVRWKGEVDWAQDEKYARLIEHMPLAYELLEKSMYAMVWCSGASDFHAGGAAEEGYRKEVKTTVDDVAKLLKDAVWEEEGDSE